MGDIALFVPSPFTSSLPDPVCLRRKRENKWSDRPPKHNCAICWFPVHPQEAVAEQRATADNDHTEQWLYCKSCWDEMVAIRKISADNGFPETVDDFEPTLTQALGLANRKPSTNGACSRLGRFLANQLNLDSKLKFLLHLDHCMHCWEQVYQATKAQHKHCYGPVDQSQSSPSAGSSAPALSAQSR